MCLHIHAVQYLRLRSIQVRAIIPHIHNERSTHRHARTRALPSKDLTPSRLAIALFTLASLRTYLTLLQVFAFLNFVIKSERLRNSRFNAFDADSRVIMALLGAVEAV
jgi:hypothetical protein